MAMTTVRIQLNNTWHNLTYNATTKKWETQINAPGTTSYNLPGGYYPVTVEATNDAGTTSTDTGARLIVRETIKPTVTITSPSEGAFLGVSSPEIAFELRDEPGGSGIDIASLSVKLDGSPVSGVASTAVTNGYDCAFTPAALSDGAHTVSITVKDNDGNDSVAASRTFTIDTTPPELDVTSPPQDLITNTAWMTVEGTTNDATSPSVTVKITLGGADQGAVTVSADGAFTKALTLAEGANTIIVTSTDTAGRVSTVTRNVLLDTTEPRFGEVVVSPNPADAGATLFISVVVT